jgi:monothiol glutaredoxin
MSDLSADTRARIDALLGRHPVLLFMKGTPESPRCGFSARVVAVLETILDDYATVDILEDPELRSGMKAYADWPTFPQLWHAGELVGGCDIVEQLDRDGTLTDMLGTGEPPTAPNVRVTDEAAAHIQQVTQAEQPRLRLRITREFRYAFSDVGTVTANDVEVPGGVVLVLDRGSAKRADGLVLGLEQGSRGPQLVVDNPNEPAKVRQLSVDDYAEWRSEGREHLLIDVRTPEERATAVIEGSRLLDDDTITWLGTLPKDTTVVFQCHHGVRSQHAAEHFLRMGFTELFNLSGGIDAWSARVDPSVPRY